MTIWFICIFDLQGIQRVSGQQPDQKSRKRFGNSVIRSAAYPSFGTGHQAIPKLRAAPIQGNLQTDITIIKTTIASARSIAIWSGDQCLNTISQPDMATRPDMVNSTVHGHTLCSFLIPPPTVTSSLYMKPISHSHFLPDPILPSRAIPEQNSRRSCRMKTPAQQAFWHNAWHQPCRRALKDR